MRASLCMHRAAVRNMLSEGNRRPAREQGAISSSLPDQRKKAGKECETGDGRR